MKKLTFLSLLFSLTFYVNAQNNVMEAVKTLNAPTIDADLSDPIWQQIKPTERFTQFEPDQNVMDKYKTEVKVAYDDNAIYYSAVMYDEHPDSIPKQAAYRDGIGANADYLCFFVDTYNDKQNGFGFCLSVANTQSEAKYSIAEGENWSWNSVWISKTKITENGWIAEVKIPFSSIRFAKEEVQDWGVNFWRQQRRKRTRSSWAPFDPNNNNFIAQWGTLKDLKNINPPIRLSATPYITTGFNVFNNKTDGTKDISKIIRGGADIKYGLNESYTLDLTLIPDFGQAQSDAQVLNLSPFEVQFEERRAFFLDGTELFNKGNLFYSRRVGSQPLKYYDIVDDYDNDESKILANPQETQLLNAVKISGRDKNGLGLGFFNAITAASNAKVINSNSDTLNIETNPLTNYNVLVVDKVLKNNGNFSFMNTNVLRKGIYRDANASKISYSTQDKKGKYEIGAQFTNSLRRNIENEEDSEIEQGHSYGVELSKISGKFLFNVGHYVESEDYSINDLGFLFNNNERSFYGRINYNLNKPTDTYNSFYNSWGLNYNRLFAPNNFTGYSLWGNNVLTLKNFTTIGAYYELSPDETFDYFEARKDGLVLNRKPSYYASAFISPDYRKKFLIDFNLGTGRSNFYNEKSYDWSIQPIIRFSDNLRTILSYNKEVQDEIGYLDEIDDVVYMSKRKVNTRVSRITGSYIFNSKMALDLTVRHYNRSVNPYNFYELNLDGSLSETNLEDEDYNTVVNFFNVDLVYKWEFAPGSEARLVWKNSIVHDHDNISQSYQKNFKDTFFVDNNNNLSLKIVYFLDWLNLKNLKV